MDRKQIFQTYFNRNNITFTINLKHLYFHNSFQLLIVVINMNKWLHSSSIYRQKKADFGSQLASGFLQYQEAVAVSVTTTFDLSVIIGL